MLKNISPLVSPALLNALASMGHGDEITIADAHYPRMGSADTVLRMDGIKIPELLDGILRLLPLDHYHEWQYALMKPVGGDEQPTIWQTYRAIIDEHDRGLPHHFERFEFYEYARHSFITVITGETAQYGNIILRKGIIRESS